MDQSQGLLELDTLKVDIARFYSGTNNPILNTHEFRKIDWILSIFKVCVATFTLKAYLNCRFWVIRVDNTVTAFSTRELRSILQHLLTLKLANWEIRRVLEKSQILKTNARIEMVMIKILHRKRQTMNRCEYLDNWFYMFIQFSFDFKVFFGKNLEVMGWNFLECTLILENWGGNIEKF